MLDGGFSTCSSARVSALQVQFPYLIVICYLSAFLTCILRSSSHKIDPIYQRKFTISWICVALGFILLALPGFIRSLRTGRVYHALFGLRKSTDTYEPVDAGREESASHPGEKRKRNANNLLSLLKVSTMWTLSFLRLDVAQRERLVVTLTPYMNLTTPKLRSSLGISFSLSFASH